MYPLFCQNVLQPEVRGTVSPSLVNDKFGVQISRRRMNRKCTSARKVFVDSESAQKGVS